MEILTIQFQNQLTFKEIPFFRGALLHSMPEESNLLFHNHLDMGFRYAYPLVQYKSIQGKAAVVCLNEGIDSVMQLVGKENLQIRIGNRERQPLLVDKISPIMTNIVIDGNLGCYHIERWIALNSENYIRYTGMKRMADRILFLENILTANILSFLKGINVYIDDELECHLLDVSDKYSIKTNKGVKMIAFDASFQTNIELPDYIGLGKHSSLGYGLITKEKHTN